MPTVGGPLFPEPLSRVAARVLLRPGERCDPDRRVDPFLSEFLRETEGDGRVIYGPKGFLQTLEGP